MSQRKHRRPSEWQALIEEQSTSGQSAMAFCKARDLCAKSFYQQRKRLGHSNGRIPSSNPGGFIQVQPADSVVATSLVLHYRASRLTLSADVSATWVAELMSALA